MIRWTRDLLGGRLPNNTYERIAETLAVLMPNLFVAPIRYFVADETKDTRLKLFYRDASAAGIGIALYYFTRGTMTRVLSKMGMNHAPLRLTSAIFLGWVANVAFQAVGAVKLSEAMSRKSAQKALPTVPKPVQPVYSAPAVNRTAPNFRPMTYTPAISPVMGSPFLR